jgi:hypothetical protein
VEVLPGCTTDDNCGYHEVCHDGFCKGEGVSCENDAGRCRTDNGWMSCGCADGIGMDGMGEVPPEEMKSDEELFEECIDMLTSACGEEAPDITEECTESELATCEAYYAKLSEIGAACGEEVEEPSYAELRFCCRDVGRGDTGSIECVMALPAGECTDLETCWDLGDGGLPLGGVADAGVYDEDKGASDDDENRDLEADTEMPPDQDEEAPPDSQNPESEPGDEGAAVGADSDATPETGATPPDGASDKEEEKDADADDGGCSVTRGLGTSANNLMNLLKSVFAF